MPQNNRSRRTRTRRPDPGPNWIEGLQQFIRIGSAVRDARWHNRRCGDGSSSPYEVVPFVYLAEDPENRRITLLPELRTAQDIRNLDDDQLNSYLTGYLLGGWGCASRKAKLTRLCEHIGCRAAVFTLLGKKVYPR
ncbi:uncharacterized protein ARMOST_19632 [Armillaria ostoyae]|uniref:Mug135-like C-terminal domain-containing protein n=1 Tax=Armillaria ostoyae TaxID=47428 RepID=A0A284S522_ARMOS|nr:uncharacterized protein ARMOST_19632 [Armillaria ostoyae]